MVDQKTQDVKPGAAGAESSTADVKSLSIEQAASKLVDGLLSKESSTDEQEAGDVLNQNATDDGAANEQETEKTEPEGEPTKGEGKEGEEEGSVEGEGEEGEETHEGEETQEIDKGGEKKTEKTVTYERFQQQVAKTNKYKDLAESHQKLLDFCQQNNITPDIYKDVLIFARLLSSDPAGARKRAQEWIGELDVASGALPADLQAEVEAGTITEARAKQLAKLQLENRRIARSGEDAEQSRRREMQNAVVSTMENWANGKQAKDPSFKPKDEGEPDGKFENFMVIFMGLNAMTPPGNLKQFIANAEKAYARLDASVQRNGGLKKPISKTVRTTGMASRGNNSTKPKNEQDVVNRVLRDGGYVLE